MRLTALACALAGAIAGAVPDASAQSLGDIARQEEVRRATAKKAVKVLTNADLTPDPHAPVTAGVAGPAASAGGFMSISEGRPLTAEEIIARSQAKIANDFRNMDERYWRNTASSLRKQIDKAQREVDALSTPVERSAQQQALTNRALARAEKILADLEERWRKLEESAHFANIPESWLEPVPTLSPQTPQ